MTAKRYLLDFEVESHGCLAEGHDHVRTTFSGGEVEIHISNLNVAPGTDRPLSSFHVVLPGESLEAAKKAGTQRLKDYLNYLSFATNLPFRIHRLIRVVDWTLGLKERECHQFERFPGSELPHHVLETPLFASVERLLTVAATPALHRALKWFSAGVSAEYSDDQFQFFWLVVELVAQLEKAPERVNDLCPKCRGPLFCQTCNTTPTHRPYPKQAIRQLFERTMKENPVEFFDLANEVRNSIMHGEDVTTIEASRGVELSDVVNTLGGVAWTALLNALTHDPEDRKRLGRLDLLQTNMYTHQTLSITLHLLVFSSDPANPKLSELAKPTIELLVSDEPKPT